MALAEEAAVVAVDVGSSGVRALAFTHHLTTLISTERPLQTLVDSTGRSAHDWSDVLTQTVSCLAEVATQLNDVQAVVLSGTASCITAATGDRTHTSDVMLWSDTRAEAHAAAVRPAQIAAYHRTLCPPHLSYWPAKLHWLNEVEAEAGPTLAFAGAKDLIFEYLTGKLWTDPMSAAATGIFDSAGWDWDAALLNTCGVLSKQLPEVRDAVQSAPMLLSIAEGLGVPASTPVVLGGMDGPLAHVGSAGFSLDAASCTVGTSIAFRTGVRDRKPDPARRLWCYPVTRDFWVLGGAGSNGGNVLGYTAALMGDEVETALAEAMRAAPDAELLLLPYIWGERSPLWRDDLRGVIVGLSPHHTKVDLNRAALDGVAAVLLELATVVMSVGGIPRRVYLTGGFLRNDAWAQLMTDSLGLETCVPKPRDATAAGAACLAWLSLGVGDGQVPARPATDIRHPDQCVHTRIRSRAARAGTIRQMLYPSAQRGT